MRRCGLLFACAFVAFAAVFVPVAWAQSGSLKVSVFERTAAGRTPIAGAVVELTNSEMWFPMRSLQTDPTGTALFTALPAGSGYLVTVSVSQYNTAVQSNIRIVAGKVVPLAVSMLPGLEEVITVTDKRPLIELGKTESTTNISAELFNDMPVYGRDYQGILILAPGINDSDGDGNVTVHGSRERDLKVTVDGVSNVDPLTGQRLSQINPDAIEEIEIIDTGADLSMGGAVGGYARITIKSGGNAFEGSAALFWVDPALNNDGAGGRDLAPFSRRKPSVYVSGPIVKDRLWYLLTAEATQATTPINVLGGPDATVELRGRTELGKITWQAGHQHRLALQYSADPLTLEPLGVSTLVPADSASDYRQGGPTYSLNWLVTNSPTSVWESTLAFSDVEYGYKPHNPLARNTCASGTVIGIDVNRLYCTDLSTGFVTGAYPRDYEDTRQRRTYGLDGNKFWAEGWGHGSHSAKYGMLLERTLFERQLEARPVISRELLIQSFVVVGTPGTGLFPEWKPRHRISLTQFYPAEQTKRVQGNNLAFYFTDTYQPLSNVTLSLGLRLNREELSADGFTPIEPRKERAAFEQEVGRCLAAGNDASVCVAINSSIFTAAPEDDPARYPACSVALNPRQCSYLEYSRAAGRKLRFRRPTPYTLINSNLARSLSVTWDPTRTGRGQIYASYARQYGDAFFEPLVSEQGPSSLTTAYNLDDDDLVLQDVAITATAFQISQFDRNITSQHQDEIVLGFEREVAIETGFRFRYVNRHYEDQYQDIDINHRPVYFDELTPDQLARFRRCRRIGEFADCTGQYALVARIGGGGGGARRLIEYPDGLADLQLISPLLNNIYKIGNFNSSRYEAYVFELERRFYQNWEASVSYVWSRSFGQAEDFSQVLGNDAASTDDERGPLSTDQRHVVKLYGRALINKWGGFRLGASVRYESGLPYSITSPRAVVDFPADLTGAARAGRNEMFETLRNVFPTGQRNDQRNAGRWNIDVNFQKEFKVKDSKATVQVSAFDLLDSDDLEIFGVRRSQVYYGERRVAQDTPVAARRFGRYFELAFKLNF